MDEAGLSARQTVDQLSHATVPMPQDSCFDRKVVQPGAVDALGVMSGEVGQSGDRWPAADGGVGAVVIVEVQPVGQGVVALPG